VQLLRLLSEAVSAWNAELELLEGVGNQVPPLSPELVDDQPHATGFLVKFRDAALSIFAKTPSFLLRLGEPILGSNLRLIDFLNLSLRPFDDVSRLRTSIGKQFVYFFVGFISEVLGNSMSRDQDFTNRLLHRLWLTRSFLGQPPLRFVKNSLQL
jgi:hypothetical protein